MEQFEMKFGTPTPIPFREYDKRLSNIDIDWRYVVYKAVDCVDDKGLFHFHENPNIKCPVGKNIHKAMDDKLQRVQLAMENELRNITVADVADDLKKKW